MTLVFYKQLGSGHSNKSSFIQHDNFCIFVVHFSFTNGLLIFECMNYNTAVDMLLDILSTK